MHERTLKLRQLMAEHNLRVADVSRLTGAAPNTVYIWRCSTGSRPIPATTLRMLAAELQLSQVANG